LLEKGQAEYCKTDTQRVTTRKEKAERVIRGGEDKQNWKEAIKSKTRQNSSEFVTAETVGRMPGVGCYTNQKLSGVTSHLKTPTLTSSVKIYTTADHVLAVNRRTKRQSKVRQCGALGGGDNTRGHGRVELAK